MNMVTIKSPEVYVNEPGVLEAGGELIAGIGRRAFIIAGKTALFTISGRFLAGLEQAGVRYETVLFEGYCTRGDIEEFSRQASEYGADVLVGIGGGRILDLVKAVGDRLEVPVAAVPTVAATCAAWSALSVLYDKTGVYEEAVKLNHAPRLVLADTEVLASAPARYLAAGIGDTLVKWYESVPHAGPKPQSVAALAGVQAGRLALDLLNRYARDAYRAAAGKKITDGLIYAIDAIILLAGQAGSISDGDSKAAVAHSIHNSLTRYVGTHHTLHGEKVAFGLLAQLHLEGKPQGEIVTLTELLIDLGLPVTLAQLGILPGGPVSAADIAQGVAVGEAAQATLPFQVTPGLLEQAILWADALGEALVKQRTGYSA
jgi:glycerol dehydrogenase-like iron-containing ADH family enzyme